MHADAVVSRLAGDQHGVVGLRQLLLAGLSRRQVERRLQTGHLIRLHRGVFAVGHTAVPPLAPYAAALLAVGEHAVLSHQAAGVVWRIVTPQDGDPVHVAVTSGHPEHRSGIRVHRVKKLDVRRREGLRLTSPRQTLDHLAASFTERAYERALNEALALRLVTDPGSPGMTRSELERAFKRVVADSGLPAPRYNDVIGGVEVDAVWRRERLAVELDSWQFHGHRLAFERDRVKDQHLMAHGFRTMRVTDRQLRRPLEVAARLAVALQTARAS